MRISSYKPMMIAAMVAVLVGIGVYAFAHMGGSYGGYGGYGMMHGGPMMHQGFYGGSGYGYTGDLSDEDFKALENERRAFYESTEDIRQEIYAKQLELQSEMAKENPDTNRASNLQDDISSLRSKLDQKRIDHMVRIRKINPDAGRGYAGMGPMMGFDGQGACW